MEGERGVTRIIIDELHSWDLQGDQTEDESGVTQSIIDEPHSWDIQGDEMEYKMELLEVSIRTSFFGYPSGSNIK